MPGAAKDDVRFVGPLMGSYTLESRIRASGVQIFALRLQSISTRTLVASAPVTGQVSERLTAHIVPFGAVRGLISRHVEGGFVVDIDLNDEDRAKLAARIDWHKKRTFAGVAEKREHKRFMPREPRSVVVFADGNVLPCLIIDASVSGAAVSADIDPPHGARLAVGKIVARVVRKLDVGFAVQFVHPVDPECIQDMLLSPIEWA